MGKQILSDYVSVWNMYTVKIELNISRQLAAQLFWVYSTLDQVAQPKLLSKVTFYFSNVSQIMFCELFYLFANYIH